MTPVLAALADDALIFPDLYGVYPATTRAHVPIMTGGRAITWGSVGDELTLPLRAPTLVSALRDADAVLIDSIRIPAEVVESVLTA